MAKGQYYEDKDNTDIDTEEESTEIRQIIIFLKRNNQEGMMIQSGYKEKIGKWKQTLWKQYGIPKEGLYFEWNGEILKDDKSIEEYGIQNGDTISLFSSCIGGKPEKKNGKYDNRGENKIMKGITGFLWMLIMFLKFKLISSILGWETSSTKKVNNNRSTQMTSLKQKPNNKRSNIQLKNNKIIRYVSKRKRRNECVEWVKINGNTVSAVIDT